MVIVGIFVVKGVGFFIIVEYVSSIYGDILIRMD